MTFLYKKIIISIFLSFLFSDNYIIEINATSYTDWVYYNFEIGAEVIIENPETSLGWDVAFQRYHIRTNSGTSGAGNGGAYVDSINLWTADLFNTTTEIELNTQFNQDTLSQSFYDEISHTFTWGTTSPTLETWGQIDTTNNYTMEITNNQLIVMTANGNNFIIFWPLDYYDDNGNSGHITLLYGTDIDCSYGIDDCGVCGGDSSTCQDNLSNIVFNSFSLGNSFPNPFNPSTTIPFYVNSVSNLSLSIYDLRGELINTLAYGLYTPGHYSVIWEGTNHKNIKVPSGVYICKIISSETIKVQKLFIIR